jgi:hypothetical protein
MGLVVGLLAAVAAVLAARAIRSAEVRGGVKVRSVRKGREQEVDDGR